MKYFLFCLIGYAVLYTVVWLHEVGHSVFDCKYGVKQTAWFKVNVKPYIFFSTPGDLDVDAWQKLKTSQYLVVAYAGVAANAIWAVIAGAVIATVEINNVYLLLALWLFLTLHTGEIFSYLLVGSIYTVSDMAIVAQVKPGLRLPNIAFGAVLAAVYVFLLIKTPCEIRTFVIVENVFTVVSMCLGRIIFSVRAKKNED